MHAFGDSKRHDIRNRQWTMATALRPTLLLPGEPMALLNQLNFLDPQEHEDAAILMQLDATTMASQQAPLPTYGPQRATISKLPAWEAPRPMRDGARRALGAKWTKKDRRRNMATPGLRPPLRCGAPWSMTITPADERAARQGQRGHRCETSFTDLHTDYIPIDD